MAMTPRRQRQWQPRRLQGNDLEALRRELQEELDDLSRTVLKLTDMAYLPQAAEPTRFQEGSLVFFMAGIAVTGVGSTSAGLHQFRAGAWRRLQEV